MSTATSTRLEIVPLSRHIGAEIRGIDLRERPDDDTVKAIYQAWLDHLVIVFPGQELSQEDFLRVTGYFGELGEISRPPKFFPKGYSRILPGIMMISNIRENGEPIGALPDGEMLFHHDMIHAAVPSKGTLLYSVEIPSSGGNTLFASGYAAYDTLDPAIRQRLEGKTAQHHYNYGVTIRGKASGVEAFAECAHPVFRTHEETARKAVYVNRLMTVRVDGLPEDESERLLALEPGELCRAVAAASGHVLGELERVTAARAFPLRRLTARRTVASRVALVGDAAHVVHPLAGQGANLGLQDARALAAVLAAREPGRDPGELRLLRRYERARAGDVAAMDATVHGLYRLFGARARPCALLRNAGLNLTGRLPVIKNLLIRQAMA